MPRIKILTQKTKGFSIILHAGVVVYTTSKDTYIIPESSVEKLKAEKIKFKVLPAHIPSV